MKDISIDEAFAAIALTAATMVLFPYFIDAIAMALLSI